MIPPQLLAGSVLIGAGAALSAVVFLHDVARWRITREIPQGAPRRLPPEIHAPAAVITGIGAGLLGGWWIGLLACAGHAVAAYGLIRRWIEGA